MRAILLLSLCAAFAGCASKPGRYDNRTLTTLTGDRAFVGVLVGSFGLTLELSADDARELRRLREAAASR